jgi:hypothetical protein
MLAIQKASIKKIKQIISNKKHDKRQNLPVTRSNPDGSCFRNTTLFPLNLPARRIRTVPGVMLALKNSPTQNHFS